MKANYRRLPAWFGPDTSFELKPAPPSPYRTVHEAGFEGLKSRLLAERLAEALDEQWDGNLRRAANEAAALAWVTPYPLLVFPALFQEKAEAALAREERQEDVRRRSRELLTV